jgi:hypothetical protein
MTILLVSQDGSYPPNQTACPLEVGLETQYGPRLRGVWRACPDHNRADPLERKTQMHPEDLMNADMPSEILLLVSGSLILVMLLLILVAALTQTAALL